MKTRFGSRLVASALLALQASIATVVIQEFSLTHQNVKSTYAAQALVNTDPAQPDQKAKNAAVHTNQGLSTDSRIIIADFRSSKESRRTMDDRQAELLRRINNARRARNIAPLRLSNTLSRAAQAHVEDIVEHNYELTHIGSDGSSVGDRAIRAGYPNRYVGENVAAGYSSVKDTFEQWMDSPGHRDNILDPDYTEIGIGYYLNAPDTSYDHYWVNVFGNPDR